MRFLRQSTATVIETPPLIDDTDGKTPEDALTVASIDVQLMQPLDSAAVPPDRATNGAFGSDTGWTKNSWTISAGVANATTVSDDLEQTPSLALVENVAYELVFDLTRSAGDVTPKIGGTSGTARSSASEFTETIIAGSGSLIEFTGNGFTGTLDNVVYKQVPIPITPAASGSANDMVLIRANTGAYWLELTAAQLAIVGRHRIQYFISGALIAWEDFMVIEEAVWDAMYAASAAGPLQSTVAGRKLDVTATGAAGLDWGNMENKSTANNLSGTIGLSLKATGMDLILKTSTAFVAIASAVWDRLLTGATHNINNSAGKRLRQLVESGNYANGLVWLDTNVANTGSTDFQDGTEVNPTSLIASVNTILASLPLHGCHVAAGSTVTFPGAQDNQEWTGEGWTLILNGKSIAGTTIIDATISGISIGVPGALRSCFINGATFAGGDFITCALGGILKLSGATMYHFFDCHHARAAALSEVDFDAAVGAQEVHIHNWHGNLIIKNMKAGDVLHFTCADGAITLDTTCTAGTVNHAGTHGFTNNGSGLTINDIGVGALISISSEARLAQLDSANVPADVAATLIDTGTTLPGILGTPAGADMTADIAGVKADTTIPQRNQAFSNIPIIMVASTDHVTPKTGLTVTGARSIDGGAEAAVSGSIAEVSNGRYSFDALAADMNGAVINFRFSSATADDTFLTVITRPA